jgi:hypothetical protein
MAIASMIGSHVTISIARFAGFVIALPCIKQREFSGLEPAFAIDFGKTAS